MAEQLPFVESVHLFNKAGNEIDRHYYPLTVSAAQEENEICRKILTEFEKGGYRYRSYIRNGKWYLCFTMYDESMEEAGICMVQIERGALEEIFSSVKGYQDWGWEIKGADEILFSDGRKIEGNNLVYSSSDCEFDIRFLRRLARKISMLFSVNAICIFIHLLLALILWLPCVLLRLPAVKTENRKVCMNSGRKSLTSGWMIFRFRSSMTYL